MGARSLSPQEEFDRDAAANEEARVVNVSPFTARFEIATMAGSKPRRFKLEPGQSTYLPVGYTNEFQGAGRQPVRATIESLTEREAFPGGRSLAMVCHIDRAADMRELWEETLAKASQPPPPVDVYVPRADGGEPIKMTVQPAAAAQQRSVPSMPMIDDEDQVGGPLDEPPPMHNDPLPAVAPSAPATGKAKNGR